MNGYDGSVAKKKISDIGAPSTIARVDSKSGMLLLPFGTDRGVSQGSVFTVWKDKEVARIRVQSSRKGCWRIFCHALANLRN